MNRYLVQIALFFTAGAISAVAVAWGCAAWSTQHARATVPAAYGTKLETVMASPTVDDLARLRANGYPAPEPRAARPLTGELHVGVLDLVGLGLNHRCLNLITHGITPPQGIGCDIRAGWPARCLSGLQWKNPPDAIRIQGGFWGAPVRERVGRDEWLYVDACAVPDRLGPIRFGPKRTLPLRPLWRGLALNAVVWAAVLWLVTLGPFEVRRLVRQATGHCLRCGYDLRGEAGAGCPECGWSRAR